MIRKDATTFTTVIALFALTPTARTDVQCPPGWIPAVPGQALNGMARIATAWDPDGPGSKPEVLVMAGPFSSGGTVPLPRLGAWDGATWTPIDAGVGGNDAQSYALALGSFQNDLIVGGIFASAGGQSIAGLARWDGAAWHALGAGLQNTTPGYDGLPVITALTIHNDELVVAGTFTSAGDVNAKNVASWNGLTWKPLGTGLNGHTRALLVYRGELIAGGSFQLPYPQLPTGLMAWDGSNWRVLDTGIHENVSALAEYNGDLVVAGGFQRFGGDSVNFIARWDGVALSELGDGLDEGVYALLNYRDELIVGGRFAHAGGQPATRVARWNGSTWQSLGPSDISDVNGTEVETLATFQGNLVVGGVFSMMIPNPTPNWALWGDYCPSGDVNCDGLVNNFDIDPFIMAMLDPGLYRWTYPTCDILNADFDHDGRVNNFDIDPFVALILGL